MSATPQKFGWLHAVLIIFFLLLAASLLMPAQSKPRRSPIQRAKTEMLNLKGACEAYKAEYGVYPSGSKTEALRELRGQNVKQHNFLESARANAFNAQGEYMDPWKTPYEIKILSNSPVQIRSAGPNKRFGDEDDLIFEGSTPVPFPHLKSNAP